MDGAVEDIVADFDAHAADEFSVDLVRIDFDAGGESVDEGHDALTMRFAGRVIG